MSKPKIRLVVATSLVVLLGLWLFRATPSPSTDEAKYMHLRRTSQSFARIAFANQFLPRRVVRGFHLDDREAKYRQRYLAEEAALVASGYFVEVSITITNPSVQQALNRMAKAFQDTRAFYDLRASTSTLPNQFVVTCHPEHAALCEKATN
jgi:hypothetical protein